MSYVLKHMDNGQLRRTGSAGKKLNGEHYSLLGVASQSNLSLIMVVIGTDVFASIQAQIAIEHMIQKLIAKLISRLGNDQ